MKTPYIFTATLAGAALLLSSCVVTPIDGYGSFTYSTNGYSASVSAGWTAASYDANGFPIYGYSYGRPVYGYTAAGVAIFSIAALTALCFVPDWGPAPWYHGHWHYPPHIHRIACPPHYSHGHYPGRRPSGVHPTHPGGVHKPTGHAQAPHGHIKAPQPNINTHRPNMGNRQPNLSTHRPNMTNRQPSISSPRPSMNRVRGASRPSGFSRSGGGGRSLGGRRR